jgi:hypothetical protein
VIINLIFLIRKLRLTWPRWLTPVIIATEEDLGSKSAWAHKRDPIWKKSITKRAGGVAQGEGPKLKPQYRRLGGGGKLRLMSMEVHSYNPASGD